MQVDRAEVVRTLRARGDEDKARRAESDLPERVDTERDASALTRLGVSAEDLELGRAGDASEDQADTGLGSGLGAGLGHSYSSEPEPLLESGAPGAPDATDGEDQR